LRKQKCFSIPSGIDHKNIYERIKYYLVFRISVTTNINERIAYLDILNYIERIQKEDGKN
jgi:hypothetical protein